LGYGLLQTGVVLVNTAEDYPEDLAMGLSTVIVSLGLRRGIGLAWVMIPAGGTCLVAALTVICRRWGVPAAGMVPLGLLALVCLAACAWAVRLWVGMGRVERALQVRVVKAAGRYVPMVVTAVALVTLLVAAVVASSGTAPGL